MGYNNSSGTTNRWCRFKNVSLNPFASICVLFWHLFCELRRNEGNKCQQCVCTNSSSGAFMLYYISNTTMHPETAATNMSFASRLRISLVLFTFWWWRQNWMHDAIWAPKWLGAWNMLSVYNLSDMDFIHRYIRAGHHLFYIYIYIIFDFHLINFASFVL